MVASDVGELEVELEFVELLVPLWVAFTRPVAETVALPAAALEADEVELAAADEAALELELDVVDGRMASSRGLEVVELLERP